MKVELLYFQGCPSYGALLPRVKRILSERGIAERLELQRVSSVEEAKALRFLGSPTLRVDGRDVESGADERMDFGMKCRLYASAEGLRPTPSDEVIEAALDRAANLMRP